MKLIDKFGAWRSVWLWETPLYFTAFFADNEVNEQDSLLPVNSFTLPFCVGTRGNYGAEYRGSAAESDRRRRERFAPAVSADCLGHESG